MTNYKKLSTLTCVMVVQQLEPEHWQGWNSKIIDDARNNSIEPLIKEIITKIEEEDCIVSEAHGIKHDKDEISVWDNQTKTYISNTKTTHIHLLIKFEKGATLENLASYIGLESQYLEKAKSGRYGYDNLLAYLIHAKDRDKYPYSPEEVITVRGENYLTIYNQKKESWTKGRATKEASEANLSVDYLISEILEGNISKNEILLTDDYYKTYALNQRKIDDAFSVYTEKKGLKTINALENGEFKKTILFITGDSGAGKTVFSKLLISKIKQLAKEKNERWEHCMTASTNPFDEYNGQEILFMDDVRGDSLTASDWLKLLDPYTVSPISARYRNKVGSAKIIIISSIKDSNSFFYDSKNNVNEDINQFIRRLDILVNINDVYHLSFPIKEKKTTPPFSDSVEKEKYIYTFSNKLMIDKNNAVRTILETFINNMKWR